MRRPLRLRRTAAALVLPLALATLAACGSESADEPTGSSAAADPGLEAGEEMPAEDFVDILEEAVDAESAAHVTITADGQSGMDMEGDMDYSTTPPSSRMTIQDDTAGGEVEVIQVGKVSYLKAPEQGDKYLKMDMSGLDSLTGGGIGLDPGATLGKMKDAVKTVTYQGAEDVDGEEMTRYTLVLDTRKLMGPEMAEMAELAELPEESTYEIWFDEDGLYRQLVSDLGEAGGKVTMKLSDWGKDVSIEAPPADQVMEMPKMPEMPEIPEMPEMPEMPSITPAPKG